MKEKVEIKVKEHKRKLKTGKEINVESHYRHIKMDTISFKQAKEHFKKQPKKSQKRDLSRKSKRVYSEKKGIPATYIKRGGTDKMDVKKIDTPVYINGERGTILKSVSQLRRVLKGKGKHLKPKAKKEFEKNYLKETKPMLDSMKDSDVKGIFIGYDEKVEGQSYPFETYRKIRKVKGFKGEEFTGIGYKFEKKKGEKYATPIRDEFKLQTRKADLVIGVTDKKIKGIPKKGTYVKSRK